MQIVNQSTLRSFKSRERKEGREYNSDKELEAAFLNRSRKNKRSNSDKRGSTAKLPDIEVGESKPKQERQKRALVPEKPKLSVQMYLQYAIMAASNLLAFVSFFTFFGLFGAIPAFVLIGFFIAVVLELHDPKSVRTSNFGWSVLVSIEIVYSFLEYSFFYQNIEPENIPFGIEVSTVAYGCSLIMLLASLSAAVMMRIKLQETSTANE